MPNLQTITDAPTILGDTTTSRVQVAKLGEGFKDPRYGEFAITQAHFDKWRENHAKLFGAEGAPIDLDHSPEMRGSTKAVGWMKELEQRGAELWANVEWTPEGADHVRSRAYKFISPSYSEKARDEAGNELGTVLKGAALTNRPFLKMAAVNLSSAAVDGVVMGVEGDKILHLEPWTDPAPQPRDTPTHMGLIDSLRTLHKLPEDAMESQVLAAATAAADKANAPENPERTLAELATAEGKVLMDATQVAELQVGAAEGKEALKLLSEQRFETAFEKALSDPKGARVVPAQKEQLKTLYGYDQDGTIALIDASPHLVSAEPAGARGDLPRSADRNLSRDAENSPVDEDRLALHERAMAIQAEKNISYPDAAHIALSEQVA